MSVTNLTADDFESTIMAFRDGVLVYSQPGALPAAALEDLIGRVKSLDMDEVRTQLDAQRAAAAK